MPPAFNPGLFQERWPLVKFNEDELIGRDIIGQGIESNDCTDEETNPLTYAEELESLQLLPAEDPEAGEEDDEEAMELLRLMNWVSGEQCRFNPRMQRHICSLFRIRKCSSQSSRGHMKRRWGIAVTQCEKHRSRTSICGPKTNLGSFWTVLLRSAHVVGEFECSHILAFRIALRKRESETQITS
ncbi:hypothetical protein V1508DRAFT_426458 [Lipomyces doorenjongii]|uniref:uncharacterized protein n=1 Tax=Lipomyces doorenjongii TaxID=383834 RepID=UPI0034CF73E6